MIYCSVNGHPVAKISVSDRGLAYGDGVFTTAKIFNGNILMLSAHLKRLQDNCQKIDIPVPDLIHLAKQLKQVAVDLPIAVMKIIITAGEGRRGYSRQGIVASNIIVSISDFPTHYLQWNQLGITLGNSELQLGLNPLLSGIKHLNRLEQVMLRRELDQRPEDDLLVTNISNHVIETSCANIFWLKDNKMYTPEITVSGIAGLMRARILAKYPNAIINTFAVEELAGVDAMFICNSVMGIVPIACYNGKKLDISLINSIKEKIMSNKSD